MADKLTFRAFERPGLYRLATHSVEGRLAGQLELQASDQFGGAAAPIAIDFDIAGAGDVEALEPNAILRTAPRADTSGNETTKCVHVDFTDPDLPWRYTALQPNGDVLPPWLVVIVGSREELSVEKGFVVSNGVDVWVDHDLNQSARWAHVQDDGNGNRISRIYSPRPLQPQREHRAVVVPAFFYDEQTKQLVKAWDGAAPARPLPALHTWRFWTAEAGDFETLAAELHMVKTGDLGTARLQYSLAGGEELDLPIGGAITSLKSAWLQDAAQTDIDRATADLDGLSHPEVSDSLGRRVLGLPEYGSPWLEKPEDAEWGKDINNDPRLRGMAGLGLWMGILEQEDLLDAAIEQFGAMNELRHLLRDLALGLLAAGRLWDRRLPQSPQAQTWLYGAALGRLPTTGATVLSALSGADRPLTPAFFSSAARRTLRRSAPWIRRAKGGYLSRGDLVDAANRCPPPPGRSAGGLAHLDGLAALQAEVLGGSAEELAFETLFEVRPFPPKEQEMVREILRAILSEQPDQPVDAVPLAERILNEVLQPLDLIGDCFPIEAIQSALEPYQGIPATEEMLFNGVLAGLAACGLRLPDDLVADLPGFVGAAALPGAADRCRPVVHWDRLVEAVNPAFNPHGEDAAALVRLRARVPWPDIRRPEPLDIPIGLNYPTWTLLNKHAREWILPGVDKVEKNTVVALQTNPPFTEAFLVGINTQFMHEMHWRGLPIDRTSTPFLMFWYPIQYEGEARRAPDIRPFDEWGADTHLGDPSHQVVLPGDPTGRRDLIILFHSDLFRRYPSTLVYLVKVNPGENEDDLIKLTPDFKDTARFAGPLFRGAIREDLVFFSFDVEPEKLEQYWLILDEPPAELRFRVDQYRKLPGVVQDGARTATRIIDKPTRVAISGEELKKLGTQP